MLRELVTQKGHGKSIAEVFVEKQALEDMHSDEESQQEEEEIMTADDTDVKIVQSFLEKFLIGSESAFLDNIDIKLMLRALPNRIAILDLPKYKKINFSIL